MAGHIADAGSLDWCTPDWILDLVRNVFGGQIDLDPCWNPNAHTNAKVSYTLPKNDGLADPWNYPTVFVNPPYGVAYINQQDRSYMSAKDFRALLKGKSKSEQQALKGLWRRDTIADWINRCAEARLHGSEVISLIPCYPDTRVWQETIHHSASVVCELRGRVSFRLVAPTCSVCGATASYKGHGGEHACEEHRSQLQQAKKLPKNTPAPMACALVYWGTRPERFVEVFGKHGVFKYPGVDVLALKRRIAELEAMVASHAA